MLSSCRVSAFCAVLLLALTHSFAWGQANANESLETAWIYVDVNNGSDSNPGAQRQPLKTIGAAASMALSNNHHGIGSRVIINPGTYREAIAINRSDKSTTLPITFQAATTGTVFVSGADIWTGWTQRKNLYTHAWPYQWGFCPAPPPPWPIVQQIVRRREMIFINGTPLTQVLSETAMKQGTFFVNESAATVYVWPPAGTDMTRATVEVATRPSLFSNHNQSHVVLRGLTFEYANSCREAAAVSFTGTTNILVDSDSFLWNNSMGLSFAGLQNFTVQSSIANHNGQLGFTTYRVKQSLWQNDTANYSNWRGAQGAFYVFDSGSARLFLDHDSTFNNLTTLFNQTNAVHFDTDNENVVFDSQIAAYNLDGFDVEKSEGPTTVSNSYFCENNLLNLHYAGGFEIRDSTHVTLTGNIFFGNQANEIALSGVLGGLLVTNWETGQRYTLRNENLRLSQNGIATNSNVAQVFFDGFLGGTDWEDFVSTLNSDYNTWAAGTNTKAFTVPAPKPPSYTNLTGWQTLTLQDAHSGWGSVKQPAQCKVRPDAPDYWLITSNFNPVTASRSGQASFNLSTVSLGGMTGTVKLSVDGLSALPGATASFSPPTITTSATSVLTVVTQPRTPAGTYPVTAIANTGNVTRTITVSVVVP